jgi:protein TonB
MREPRIRAATTTLLLLAALLSPAEAQDEDQVIPLAPIDVTAPYPLTPPVVKKVSKPAYPEAARRREEQGTVTLALRVLADGRVGEVTVKKGSGSRTLDDAAVAEAGSWEFIPGRRGTKAVEAWVEVPVKFQLVE